MIPGLFLFVKEREWLMEGNRTGWLVRAVFVCGMGWDEMGCSHSNMEGA